MNSSIKTPFGGLSRALLVMLLGVFLLQSPARADEMLWESGLSLYIKITDQERPRRVEVPPNQHPVELDSEEITRALSLIEAWDRGGMFSRDELKAVFAISQARLLGTHLANGLARAEPDQEIEFAIARTEGGFYRQTRYAAGRAFYLDNRLHVILGDYDRAPDRFKEHTHRTHGVLEVKYHFTTGSRGRQGDMKDSVVVGDGIDVQQDDRGVRRNDWIIVDVPQAARAYAARLRQQEEPETAEAKRLRRDAARMQREQRELRAEMARMRQEIRQMSEGGGSGAGSSTQTVEERLAILDQLREQGLITDEEYRARRQEILSDI